ncbi:unnamed protein product [Orchesella dallaii]|uniref:Odorant receptor n=1 Tax=Orchesella dallaii TaxID=48710 RepID=A0ABP1S7R4_9HEXA
MEFSEAAMKLYLVVQRHLHFPLIVELPSRQRLIENPNFTKFHRLAWRFNMFASIFLCFFSFAQIMKVHHTTETSSSFGKQFPWHSTEQLCVYFIILTVNMGGIAAYWTVYNYPSDLRLLASQSLAIGANNGVLASNLRERLSELLSAKKLFVYFSGIPFLLLIICHFVIPFMRPFDPLQVFVNPENFQQHEKLLFKIGGSIVLGVPTAIGVLSCFQFFLGIVLFVEVSVVISKDVYDGGGVIHSVQQYYVEQCLECWILIKLHHRMPLLIHAGAGIYIVAYEMFAYLLVSMGAVPHEKSKRFRSFWRHVLTSPRERMQLKSCYVLAYSAGPIRKVRARTVLDINNALLNATASLTLMKD